MVIAIGLGTAMFGWIRNPDAEDLKETWAKEFFLRNNCIAVVAIMILWPIAIGLGIYNIIQEHRTDEES